MAEEISPPAEAWKRVQAQLDKKGNWLDGLHRLLISKTWQVATVTAVVVLMAVVAAIWQLGGVGQAPTMPAPTPAPSPPSFEVSLVSEEAHYLPRETVEAKLSITNVSSAPIILDPYPPEIKVKPRHQDKVAFSVSAGTQPCFKEALQ